jgi:hypothetical protein
MAHDVRNVARTRHCKIDHCSCGAVHVSVGSTTVRIDEAAARELRDALTRAISEIDAAAGRTTTATSVGQFTIVLPDDDPKKIH